MSIEFLCFLNDEGGKLYLEALNLMEVESKFDPVTSPHQSHYKARKILEMLVDKIENIQKIQNNDDVARALAVLHLKLAINRIETDELSAGENELKRCRSLIDNCDNNYEKNSGINQEVLNHLGLLYSRRTELDKALEYLLESKSIYEKFVKDFGGCPWTVDNFFQTHSFNAEQNSPEIISKRIDIFEDNYTHTLYYLAQIFGKLERNIDSALYCKETLKRQLDRNKYEPLEWAMNAATLSQYYITIYDFTTARYCLASAETILKEFGEKPASLKVPVTNADGQDAINVLERLPKAWADLFRCWSKYSLVLLEHSRDSLMEKSKDDEISNIQNSSAECNSKKEFFNLETTSAVNQITDRRVLVFDEAKQVFLQTQSWLNSAKEFYCLDDHCSDYVDIVKDNSTLFKLLLFFEPDLTRQCKMHKRRADMLTEILHLLNPQFYLDVCRQLAFEIGEVFTAILDNKLALLELTGSARMCDGHANNKINILAKKSIEYFQLYLSYLKKNDKTFPETFQDDDERPALIAHFHCGRLFSKILTASPKENLQNTKNSLDCYNFLVEYCRKNPSAAKKVKEERDACEEMVKLLPGKMDKIKSCIS
ncbi:hypothetical protein HELRODRAFT_81219 [Helobdella robusta]|uniref:KIF-binding protein n=1 Tax=Helobdella robusta TaxID=6412 RepID=T1G4B4_HELRO|nr:hypothetical protein HELRODRAFT_81219 [Helobdella robusta]ESO02769.1 hypothetical protein HELRODRAFT_81219 [Helobdella robusta]